MHPLRNYFWKSSVRGHPPLYSHSFNVNRYWVHSVLSNCTIDNVLAQFFDHKEALRINVESKRLLFFFGKNEFLIAKTIFVNIFDTQTFLLHNFCFWKPQTNACCFLFFDSNQSCFYSCLPAPYSVSFPFDFHQFLQILFNQLQMMETFIFSIKNDKNLWNHFVWVWNRKSSFALG